MILPSSQPRPKKTRKQKTLSQNFQHSYPYNLDFDSYKALEGLSRFCINNLGDPFIESNYGVHSRAFEIGVLEWFARLWEAPTEEEGTTVVLFLLSL